MSWLLRDGRTPIHGHIYLQIGMYLSLEKYVKLQVKLRSQQVTVLNMATWFRSHVPELTCKLKLLFQN